MVGCRLHVLFPWRLSRAERFSFNPDTDRALWIGSDATHGHCSSVDHTDGLATVFDVSTYADFLFSLTGLPRGAYELIDIAEFLTLIGFLIRRTSSLQECAECYVGENKNVATLTKCRRPGSRAAKYFVRILNRLANEYGFTVIPMCTSILNNNSQDESSRLKRDEAIQLGQRQGMRYIDVGAAIKSYLSKRMRGFSVIPPSESIERVRIIMQYVEKRTVWFIPPHIFTNLHICAFGIGAGGCGYYVKHPRIETVNWPVTPWQSEQTLMGLPIDCTLSRPKGER